MIKRKEKMRVDKEDKIIYFDIFIISSSLVFVS